MLRTYTVRAVALAIGATAKWVDNLLSRNTLPGVARSRQGVERRITDEGLLAIEIARILNVELGVSMERAAEIASEVMNSNSGSEASVATPSGLALHFPVAAITRRVRESMVEAVEAVARVPRGRPRRSG